MDRTLVVLDTETANGRGAPHMIELAAVRVTDGEVVEHFASLIAPEIPVEPDAYEVHGIGDDDLRDAPPVADVLARFTEWAGDDWLVAHDAPRDAAILGFEAARHGAPVPAAPFLCTLRLARIHIPDSPDHKLETLVQYLDLEAGERHRALDDAVACWKVLEECFQNAGEGASSAALLAQCGAPTTVAGASPRPPRMKPRLRALAAAREAGEDVTLVYGDGDEAPVPLPVRPRFLYQNRGKGYLEAECTRTAQLKTYRLDRVHKIVPAS